MATVNVFPIAATTAGTPRVSQSVNYAGKSQTVTVQLLSSTWATDDPTTVVSVILEQSFDGGTTWRGFSQMDVHPGQFNYKTGGVPALTCTAGDSQGARLVRAVLAVDRGSLNLGADATVT